ncbi:MAG: hypothetical protein AB8G95_25365 [Anaerolineae bacterium]
MFKQTKLFAQMSGYMLIGTLSIFGLMAILGMGQIGRAAASAPQVLEPSPGEAVPSDMNYQGILRDGDGNLVETGEYNLTFRIYDEMAAGEELYKQAKNGIIVRDGRFTTTLSGIPTTVFTAGADRFIGVTVEPFAEMVPRERLASVPYAVQAEDAFNGVPIGGVVDWWRPAPEWEVPDGFVVCDGSPVNDPLSPINGINTPNLIGQMVRGASPNTDEMEPGGVVTQTVSFANGTYLQSTVNTASAGAHNHTISGHTGGVTSVNAGDPGQANYWVREFNNGWTNQTILVAEPPSAANARGEGNHKHDATGLIVSGDPGHFHEVTLPGLTGTQVLDNLPPHINLLKICRTR